MKKSIGNFKGEDLYLKISSYRNNQRIYIGLETKEEPYANVTINLPDMLLPDIDYIFLDNSMSEELRKFLEEKQIIGETLGAVRYNMGIYEITQVDFDILHEYDSKGMNNFFDSFEAKYGDSEVELS